MKRALLVVLLLAVFAVQLFAASVLTTKGAYMQVRAAEGNSTALTPQFIPVGGRVTLALAKQPALYYVYLDGVRAANSTKFVSISIRNSNNTVLRRAELRENSTYTWVAPLNNTVRITVSGVVIGAAVPVPIGPIRPI